MNNYENRLRSLSHNKANSMSFHLHFSQKVGHSVAILMIRAALSTKVIDFPHTGNRYDVTLWAPMRDKTKNIFLYIFTELKTYHFSCSIHKHAAVDIADSSSIQEACHVNFVIDLAQRRVSVAQ